MSDPNTCSSCGVGKLVDGAVSLPNECCAIYFYGGGSKAHRQWCENTSANGKPVVVIAGKSDEVRTLSSETCEHGRDFRGACVECDIQLWTEANQRAEIAQARKKRVEELLVENTKLLDEARGWKLRFKAAQALLRLVLVEDPLKRFLSRVHPEDEMNRELVVQQTDELWRRVDVLEHDYWGRAAEETRLFLAALADQHIIEGVEDGSLAHEKLVEFLTEWRRRLKAVLDTRV